MLGINFLSFFQRTLSFFNFVQVEMCKGLTIIRFDISFVYFNGFITISDAFGIVTKLQVGVGTISEVDMVFGIAGINGLGEEVDSLLELFVHESFVTLFFEVFRRRKIWVYSSFLFVIFAHICY